MKNERRFYFMAQGLSLAVLLSLFLCGVSIRAYAQSYFFKTNTTINANDPTYENYDLYVDNCTVTINGSHTFSSLTVQNNGVVTCAANPSQATSISVLYDIVIFPGASIDVSGKGQPARLGSGAGAGSLSDGYGGGGAYGGEGGYGYAGFNGGGVYGSITQPLDLGSGGGGPTGGAGGGAVQLTVSGRLSSRVRLCGAKCFSSR